MLKRKLYKTLLEWKSNDKGTTAVCCIIEFQEVAT